MKMPSKRFISVLAVIVLPAFAFLGWGYCNSECECFWNPWIDTFNDGYSEESFSKIEFGMTMEEVNQIMGTSIQLDQNENVETVWFTGDGKCKWGDFAWVGRGATLSKGVVKTIWKQMMYD